MFATKSTLLSLSVAFSLLITSCGSRNQTKEASETAVNTPASATDTLCFAQVVGRDSVRLHLITKGTRVTGDLVLRPYEKDRAQGPLIGVRTGDGITADWERSGEGVTQVYALDFVMTDDSVRWRDGERIEKGGKWVLKTPDAGFDYKLTKTDCQ